MVRGSSGVLVCLVFTAACTVILGGCPPPRDASDTAGGATTDSTARRARTATTSDPPKGPEVDVALAFVKELNSGDHAAAYQCLSPLSREAISQADWTESALEGPTSPSTIAFLHIATAGHYSIGEVAVQGDHASATFEMTGTRPVPVHLVREGGKWWVDWTEEAQVRGAVDSMLRLFRPGEGLSGLALAQWGQMDMSPLLPVASRLFTTCEAVSAATDGDRAVVGIAGTGTATAVCAVQKRGGRWRPTREISMVEKGADPGNAKAEAAAALSRTRGRAGQTACLSNIKQICLGLLMYAQDNDARFPTADNWSDAIHPYVKNEAILKCPSSSDLECGYAFNQNLSGKRLADVPRPAETVMVFESTLGKRNATDTGQSWPRPGRHNDGNNVGYVDGHAKWLSKEPDFSLPPP